MNQKPLEDSENEGARFQNSISDDGRSTKLRDDSDEIENGSGGTNPHIPFFVWKDPHIWRPPEPADMMERFASDDDDDWNDNKEWGRSNFGSNHNNKEERQTATKWRLKTFVGRLLASEGLSFKNKVAQKKVPTKLNNPRLVLVKGVFKQSSIGFTSFNSMEQENTHFEKFLNQIAEIDGQKVVLVGKSVPRDMQEIRGEEVTLVLDVRLQDLERIARFTESGIISIADVLEEHKLKQLLDEHKLKQFDSFHIEKFTEEHNGVGEGGKRPQKTLMFLEGCRNPFRCTILLKGANSKELKKVKHMMQHSVCAAYHLILETSFFEDQRVFLSDKNAVEEENLGSAETEPSVVCDAALYMHTEGTLVLPSDSPSSVVHKEIEGLYNLEGIVVLVSSRCIMKKSACKRHLSHIKYYGNSDVPLGRYLQDILLNQKGSCSSCSEPPEDHMYSYTHYNGNITVILRHLTPESYLASENEGKIWMWNRCLRCGPKRWTASSTQRVVISPSARKLSFGKFLELYFSSHSAARVLSSCGHSLHKDCLLFFGLGSKVVIFGYSHVHIYAAREPPPILELNHSNGHDWLKEELKNDKLVEQKKGAISHNNIETNGQKDSNTIIGNFYQINPSFGESSSAGGHSFSKDEQTMPEIEPANIISTENGFSGAERHSDPSMIEEHAAFQTDQNHDIWSHDLSTEEMDLLRSIAGCFQNVSSVSEEETYSIIALALAMSKYRDHLLDILAERETEVLGEPHRTMEKSNSLISNGSFNASHKSFKRSESEISHSPLLMSPMISHLY
uniref:Uncharacterized protein n=1 Tax=Ananas comosus var. bracteatus TaxID=296719 RepID=A0A6V7NHS8_ANACO|nr:unnamed protein product [Ananas comosus var. bracteatus]